MSQDCNHSDTAPPTMFDIANPAGPLEFLGLLQGQNTSENQLLGLFAWTCPTCAELSRATAAVTPSQACLAEWTCPGCSQPILIQFRGRPATDWITQHNLAITGGALRCAADKQVSPDAGPDSSRRGKSSQRIFALIAVPALAVIIALNVQGAMQMLSARASNLQRQDRCAAIFYSWLQGYWTGGDSDDILFFDRVDPITNEGSYARFESDGKPGRTVRFRVLPEEMTDDRLVLRESDSESAEALLYITAEGQSLVRMVTEGGQPVTEVYHRIVGR